MAAELPGAESDRILEHAAGCAACARQLSEFIALLTEEPSREELAFLDSFRGSTAGITASIRGSAPPVSRLTGQGWSWSWAIAAAIIVVAGVSWWAIADRPAAPLTLLAAAYSEHRTLDLRVAGAAYAPLAAQRGGAEPGPSLLEAQAILDRHLQRHLKDARWLEAEGLAHLLAGRYNAAIDALRRAEQIEPQPAQVQVDLASALAQRALASDQSSDLEAAENMLDRAIASDPRNLTAVFNRAIVRERRGRQALAVEDWNRYLGLDPRSGWANEAKEHLNRLERR